MTDEGEDATGRAPDTGGGEAPCWLNRLCPDCDAVLDAAPPTRCPRCGAEVRPH
ncbi:hypothetical protein [Kitasatospora sp. NBC_00315]|uniref:hypothetical protein n=1 Tax=Kitasatospora sp. NBC_00315 TaxID=2975963 RepID=UPI003250B699